MHVLFHMQTIGMSGGVKVTLDLAEHLARAGQTVTLVLDELPKNALITTALPTYLLRHDGTLGAVQLAPSPTQSLGLQTRLGIYRLLKKRLRKYAFAHRLRWRMIDAFYGRKMASAAVRGWMENLGIDVVVSTSVYSRQYVDQIFAQVRPVVLSLHNDVFDISRRRNLNISPRKLLRHLQTYSAIVCVSTAQQKRLLEFSPSLAPIATTIRNMVNADSVGALADAFVPKPPVDLIYVGSLVRRKRVDRILRALATVADRHLTIVGEGNELENLRTLAEQLHLKNRVEFTGQVPNPLPYIKQAKALVLASEYEALPNVILEAFALRTPVLASDCETGPRELMTFGRGELLPNDDGGFVRHFAGSLRALEEWDSEDGAFNVATELSADKTVAAWLEILYEDQQHA